VNSVRRTTAGCLLIAFCAVVLFTGCGGNPAASDGSPYDTGSMYWDVRGVQQAPITAAWTHVWDQSYRNQIIPVLGTAAEGRLYQGGQGLLELDVTTGKELVNVNWTKEHPVYLESAPLLYQSKLYGIVSEQKATETAGVSLLYQRLSCLDAATGKVLWQSDEIGTWEKPCGRPLLLGGKVYAAACFPVPESGKALETDVHAAVGIWDAATGTLTGRIPLPTGADPDAQLVSDGTSVYGNAISNPSWGHICSSLFRYDPVTARTSWSISYPTASNDFINMSVALAVDGETLIAVFRAEDSPYKADGTSTVPTPARHVAAAFDTATGHLLWSKTKEIPLPPMNTEQSPEVAVQSGVAFFTVQDGTLIAVDERTGVQKWSYNAGIYAGRGMTAGSHIDWYLNLLPMATRDVLYVQEGENDLVALNPATGAKLWQKTLLTRDEQGSESKQLCCIVPVDKGLIIVTANSSDLYPIIELWK
jgi:outer membrane protein assembly factor BamB